MTELMNSHCDDAVTVRCYRALSSLTQQEVAFLVNLAVTILASSQVCHLICKNYRLISHQAM